MNIYQRFSFLFRDPFAFKVLPAVFMDYFLYLKENKGADFILIGLLIFLFIIKIKHKLIGKIHTNFQSSYFQSLKTYNDIANKQHVIQLLSKYTEPTIYRHIPDTLRHSRET